ncbi:MAG: DNA translocase FtsK 4TM domain-containing protein [Candidatus Magasanikbacteria bacterium]|nr:DNA translocase FtsK 4TM domain-containing protein [Candidatus Magasanikbacteria bacterium]
MPKNHKEHRKNKVKQINPEIKRSLSVIFLFILAGLCILSFFNLGGAAGFYINKVSGLIFGQLRLIFPLAIIFTALLVEFSDKYQGNSRHIWGFLLLIVGAAGISHLTEPTTSALEVAKAGAGGGFLGFGISFALQKAFGFWASLTILVGLILASVILLLNTTLANILQTQKNLFLKLGTFGKIVIGVLTLFARKSPTVANYSASNQTFVGTEPEVEFQSQKIKTEKAEESKLAFEQKNHDRNDNLKDAHEALLDAPIFSSKSTHKLPPLTLLTSLKSQPSAGDIKGNLYTIQKTFYNFNIPVEMGEVKVGPTVSQYSLKPADGIKLTRITSLGDNLALALAAHPIRIEAPIPGKSLVGIEIPNQKIAIVTLRELLDSKEWQTQRGTLKVAVGKDVSGRPWFTDISSLPHLLVAGATGSGKTIYLNALILSLLLSHTSETLRFIFVDPKRVELHLYNGIPHLLTPVITDQQKTVNALRWTIGEMERRLEILSKSGKRNLKEYNAVMEEYCFCN